MNLAECRTEYDRANYWRDGWTRMSLKREAGQLQSRQDRIEHRARVALARVLQALHRLEQVRLEHETTEFSPPARPTCKVGAAAPLLVERRLPDVNNMADARTVYSYEGAVRFEIEVGQPRSSARRNTSPFEAKATWGSRHGLTMAETSEFVAHLTEAMHRANADVDRRNRAMGPATRPCTSVPNLKGHP